MDCDSTARSAGAAAAATPKRAVFAVAIVLAAALSTMHGARIVAATPGSGIGPTLLFALVGVLVADFLSGVVHWACDTWGNERSRWFGDSLIRSFREHHRSPTAMLAHDWIEVNGEAATAATGLFVLMLVEVPAGWLQQHPSLYTLAWATISIGALSNQLHQWAHTPSPPRPVKALQRWGLVLSMRRHAPHHRDACVYRYCISTGWMNASLDAIGFWRGLEHAIQRVTGTAPRASDSSGS
jgi:ubiquitin-conjugating enzyme E2 variant